MRGAPRAPIPRATYIFFMQAKAGERDDCASNQRDNRRRRRIGFLCTGG